MMLMVIPRRPLMVALLGVIALVALQLLDKKPVMHQHNILVPTSTLTQQSNHRKLSQAWDPKTVQLKVTTDIKDTLPLLFLPLKPLPPQLQWQRVSDSERAATSTCSSKEPSLDYCCIGQCRNPPDRLFEQEGPYYDELFYKPDMDDIITMKGLLPFLHEFVERKRLERHPNRPHLAYPTCTLWFIGDSTTEDQSMAAICQLLDL